MRKPIQPPMVYVSVRQVVVEGTQYLRWIVENRSERDSQVVEFPDGSILNYEIKNTNTGWFYRNSVDELRAWVVLRKGEKFEYDVNLTNFTLLPGHYRAQFWAVSTEGTPMKMIIQFDIP
ncbi:MAG: hypothetical protein Q8S19_08925 [Bacillota bacterium]|nr:hypothetical protein [Bacillota bacterium]